MTIVEGGIKIFPQFSMGLLKPCILFVDIMKMCMWSFGGDKIIFDRITAFKHSHLHFRI